MSTRPLSPTGVERALAPLDRRGFLRLAGAIAATGLLPSGCGAVPASLAPPPDRVLAVLTPRAYATFQAFSMRLVGPRLGAEIAARGLDPAGVADAWVARQPALGAVLGQGLAVLEWSVWPLLPKWRPFTALAGEGQDRVVKDLLASRWDWKRDLYRGLESLATLAVYSDPAARALIGDPGPFDAEGIRLAMTPLDEG